ncbi:YesL family protein [Paenibacillus larvae]|uniref:YesL family protein n=1 Tax=Paenibacillus larvae TaxID=1464 RepID=UPI00391765AE
MEFRGIMGGLYRLTEWITRLAAINLLGLLASFLFFWVVLAGLNTPEMWAMTLLLLAVLAPFTLLPSMAAMFSVVRKWVMGDEDVPLFETFFKGYKENYLQSMLGGLTFVLLAIVVFVNYKFYAAQSGTFHFLSYLFLALGFILTAAIINFVSITVHLHMKVRHIVKNALLITVGNPLNAFSLIVVNALITYIGVKFPPLILFFAGSVMATYSFWMFYRNFLKIRQKQEKMAQALAEQEKEDKAEELSVKQTPNKA